jgi:hypothetical protein
MLVLYIFKFYFAHVLPSYLFSSSSILKYSGFDFSLETKPCYISQAHLQLVMQVLGLQGMHHYI